MEHVPVFRFQVRGRRPSPTEATQLSNIPFHRTWPTAVDIAKTALICVLAFGLAWLFAFHAWNVFTGRTEINVGVDPGDEYYLYHWEVYVLAIVGTPMGILGGVAAVQTLLRDPRPTQATTAMKTLWTTVMFNTRSPQPRFGHPSIAITVLRRLLPTHLPIHEAAVAQHIWTMRAWIEQTANAAVGPRPFRAYPPSVECTVLHQHQLSPVVTEIRGRLTLKDRIKIGQQDTTVASVIEIDIAQTFINAQGYWFCYDLYPVLERC